MLDTRGYQHKEHVILNAVPLLQWLHELASVLHYMYIRVLCPLSDIPRTHFFISHTARPEVTACTPVLSDNQICRQPLDNVPHFNYMCVYTVVGIATGPWAGRSKFRTPAGREIFSSPKLSAQPASNSTGIGLLFRE
jgi:hypothetical protein